MPDLSLNPCNLCQPANPVQADAFALVNQVIMRLTIAADLATLGTRVVQQFGLAPVFSGSHTHPSLQPGMEPARLEGQAPTHGPNGKMPAMPDHKPVSHLASLAKYAVAFLRCRVPRKPMPAPASTCGCRDPFRSRPMPPLRTCPSTHRASACSPETRRNLADWVASLGDLGDRVTLEVVAKSACAHHGLLISKLAEKASMKHEAIP